MRTIEIDTESFLFESPNGVFRAIPFYNLSMMEWVIYEEGIPTYYFTFDRRQDPFILHLTKAINGGKELDQAVQEIGKTFNRNWTIDHNIQGKEIENTWQSEKVKLLLITDLTEVNQEVGKLL